MKRFVHAFAALSGLFPSFALALTISATADRDISSLMSGETFSVTYQAENFPLFAGADIGVVYDPAVINATGITFGTAWTLKSGTVPPITPGVINNVTFTVFLDPQVSGDVELFTLDFVAVAPGTTMIMASEIFGGVVGDGILPDAQIDIETLTATVVPLPPAAALLLGGLAALGIFRRKSA